MHFCHKTQPGVVIITIKVMSDAGVACVRGVLRHCPAPKLAVRIAEAARGDRNADWDADRSIQMQVICDDAVAEAIAEHIHLTYFDDYAVTVFITEVGVLRPAKF